MMASLKRFLFKRLTIIFFRFSADHKQVDLKQDIYQVPFNGINVPEEVLKTSIETPCVLNIA